MALTMNVRRLCARATFFTLKRCRSASFLPILLAAGFSAVCWRCSAAHHEVSSIKAARPGRCAPMEGGGVRPQGSGNRAGPTQVPRWWKDVLMLRSGIGLVSMVATIAMLVPTRRVAALICAGAVLSILAWVMA